MADGYLRQSSGDIVTDGVIQASHFNNEYNAIEDAFNATSGHNHDGTAGGGAKIVLTASVTGLLPLANGGTNASDAATARSNLGVAIGTDVQAFDAGLQSIAGLTTAADRMLYTTALDTYAVTTLTPFARTFLDDVDAPAVRTTIGLGTIATQNAANVAITGGTAALSTLTTSGDTTVNGNLLATTFARIGSSGSPAHVLDVKAAGVGVSIEGRVTNIDNTNTASHAVLGARSGGALGGDAFISLAVTGAQEWVMGVDNSDDDKFKLSVGSTLGTNDAVIINPSGSAEFLSGGTSLLVGADNGALTKTNATLKASRIATPHYTNAEEPMALLVGLSGVTSNEVIIGGGSSSLNAATQVTFYTGVNNTTVTGTEKARITSTGQLLVGTTSAYSADILTELTGASNSNLKIGDGVTIHARSGNSGAGGLWVGGLETSGAYRALNTSVVGMSGNAGGPASWSWFVDSGKTIGALFTPTLRAKLDANGIFLVGKSASGLATAGVELGPLGELIATKVGGSALYLNRTTSDGTIAEFRKDNSIVGSISITGSATAFNTSSDRRMKQNIVDAGDVGAIIDAVQIKRWDWVNGGTSIGIIAQDAVMHVPEAIHVGDSNDALTPSDEGFQPWGVDQSKLVPYLWAELQSVRRRLEILETV